MRYLSVFEERLVELVHILSYGTAEEHGLTLYEVKQVLLKCPSNNLKRTVLEKLEESDKFIEQLKNHLSCKR